MRIFLLVVKDLNLSLLLNQMEDHNKIAEVPTYKVSLMVLSSMIRTMETISI